MSTESKPEPRRDAGAKLSFLRHPLTVVLVGSVISSLAIPYISARINDRRLISDARLQRCLEILRHTTETDQRLNTTVTTIEMFVKDSIAAGRVSDEERRRVRIELAGQYRELDRQMWWWSSRLPTEARLLRIEVDPAILSGIIREYQDNLIRSTTALDKLWEACLRQKQLEPAAMQEIAGEARRELAGLHAERQDLTGKLVYLFAPPEPTVLRLLRQQ